MKKFFKVEQSNDFTDFISIKTERLLILSHDPKVISSILSLTDKLNNSNITVIVMDIAKLVNEDNVDLSFINKKTVILVTENGITFEKVPIKKLKSALRS